MNDDDVKIGKYVSSDKAKDGSRLLQTRLTLKERKKE